MKQRLITRTSVVAVAFLILSTGYAADRTKASCIIDPSGKIEGTNVDKLVEIASVSKVLTTHWVVKKLGAHRRFITKINLTEVDKETYDIHITGGMDPLFSKSKFQFMVSELNKVGVTKVRNMTFDESFKYADPIRTGGRVANNPEHAILGRNGMITALRDAVKRLNDGYATFRKNLENKAGISMVSRLALGVQNIDGLAATEYQSAVSTRTFMMSSSEVHVILKEMNRKSNNYIANMAFRAMGDASAYKAFIEKELGLNSEDLMMGNGSGYPIKVDGKRFDNRATCSAVVRIIKDMREALVKEDLRLGDVVAVAGSDASDDSPSTTSAVYKNETTEDALIAKTGTSDPVVALAGAASTKEGVIYFSIMMADGRPGKAASARSLIGQEVRRIFKRFGGPEEIGFKARGFSMADKGSMFVEVTGEKLN